MKYIKTYDKYSLNDIENIHKVRNKKILKILEYYTNTVEDNHILKLNINIKLWYILQKNIDESYFTTTKPDEKYDNPFFYNIKSMWVGSKFPDKQGFKEFDDTPDFIVELETTDKKRNSFSNRFLIEDNDKKTQPIVDTLYNYVIENQDKIKIKGFVTPEEKTQQYYNKFVGKFLIHKDKSTWKPKNYIVLITSVNPKWKVGITDKIWPSGDSISYDPKTYKIEDRINGYGYHYSEEEFEKLEILSPQECYNKYPKLITNIYDNVDRDYTKGEKGWADWYWKSVVRVKKSIETIDEFEHYVASKKYNL